MKWKTSVPMVRLLMLSLALLGSQALLAATVGLDDVSGAAGDQVKLSLAIDDVPLDGSGGFFLELDLTYDPILLSPGSAQLGELASRADFLIATLTADPSVAGQAKVSVTSSFTNPGPPSTPAPPGGGVLALLPFTIAGGALPSDSSLVSLTLSDVSPLTSVSLVDGSVTVVPLPAAFWMMLAGVGLVAGRIRRSQSNNNT
jgi:hypothetical protein